MKSSLIALAVFLFVAAPALAQAPAAGQLGLSTRITAGELTPTPEMWFYEQQLRESKDPKTAVRKKAEFKTEQRQKRMAALKWFGFSNQRPQAISDPLYNDYSPRWTSNHASFPNRWCGRGRPWIILQSAGSGSRMY